METQADQQPIPADEQLRQAQALVESALAFVQTPGPDALSYGVEGVEPGYSWAQGPQFTAVVQAHNKALQDVLEQTGETANRLFYSLGIAPENGYINTSIPPQAPGISTVDDVYATRRLQLAIDATAFAQEIGYDPATAAADQLVQIVATAVQARDELRGQPTTDSGSWRVRERLERARELVAQSAARAYSERADVDAAEAARLRKLSGILDVASQAAKPRDRPPLPGHPGAPLGAVGLFLGRDAYRMGDGTTRRIR